MSRLTRGRDIDVLIDSFSVFRKLVWLRSIALIHLSGFRALIGIGRMEDLGMGHSLLSFVRKWNIDFVALSA